MIQYFELFDIASFILFACILYWLGAISKRLGEVMGMKKYYYIYYSAIVFILLASLIKIIYIYINKDIKIYSYASFSIGMTLGLIVSIRYWGWLIKEIMKV